MTPEPEGVGTPAITLRTFLVGDGDPAEKLGRALERSEVREVGASIGARTGAELRVVKSGLGKAVGDLLQLDLVEVLVSAWTTFDKVLSAARTSVASAEPQRVVLLEHTVTSRHHPRIDVLVDGVRKASVAFEIGLDFTVKGLVATLHSGSLTAFDIAGCELTAFVASQGQRLFERSGELLRGYTLVLPGGGLPLVMPPGYRKEAGAPSVPPPV